MIRCPSCGNEIAVSERGCNMVTCRAEVHRPGYFYFCYHCRRSLGDGLPCLTCPERNDRGTRNAVKSANNEWNRLNPISLDSDEEAAPACADVESLGSAAPGDIFSSDAAGSNTTDITAGGPDDGSEEAASVEDDIHDISPNLLSLPTNALAVVLHSSSVRSLWSLSCTSSRAKRRVVQHAEALLKRLCAAACPKRAMAIGAPTIYRLALLCGRRPLMPVNFVRAALDAACALLSNLFVDVRALELIFLFVQSMHQRQEMRDLIADSVTYTDHRGQSCLIFADVEEALRLDVTKITPGDRTRRNRRRLAIVAAESSDPDYAPGPAVDVPEPLGITVAGNWTEDLAGYFGGIEEWDWEARYFDVWPARGGFDYMHMYGAGVSATTSCAATNVVAA
jgi:hypothetical protein